MGPWGFGPHYGTCTRRRKNSAAGFHKMANITGAMPKPMHEKAKAGLQDIWMAETKKYWRYGPSITVRRLQSNLPRGKSPGSIRNSVYEAQPMRF
jgi:hypothetical protein